MDAIRRRHGIFGYHRLWYGCRLSGSCRGVNSDEVATAFSTADEYGLTVSRPDQLKCCLYWDIVPLASHAIPNRNGRVEADPRGISPIGRPGIAHLEIVALAVA